MSADIETKEALAEFYGGKVIWTQECGPEGRRIMRSEEKGVPFAHLITAYYPNTEKWEEDMKTRRIK